MWSVMMVMMMRVGARRVLLIRMCPLNMTGKVRMRVTAVGNGPIDKVGRRVGLDWFGTRDGGHPCRTAESPLVLTLPVARVVILSIVGNDEVAIARGERPRSG